jgi:hypothetical protein
MHIGGILGFFSFRPPRTALITGSNPVALEGRAFRTTEIALLAVAGRPPKALLISSGVICSGRLPPSELFSKNESSASSPDSRALALLSFATFGRSAPATETKCTIISGYLE